MHKSSAGGETFKSEATAFSSLKIVIDLSAIWHTV